MGKEEIFYPQSAVTGFLALNMLCGGIKEKFTLQQLTEIPIK
jgi:hypothetical protein